MVTPQNQGFNLNFYTFTLAKMNVQAIYEYFTEVYRNDHEILAVLEVLMKVNWDEQGLLDFMNYYGFDAEELDAKITKRYSDER